MQTSKIIICNLALATLGEDSIRDFDEGNKRARMCDIFYETSRDYLLGQFDWAFARAQKELMQITEPGAMIQPGQYAYALPSDCHRPLDLCPEGSRQDWELLGDNFICNLDAEQEDTVVLRYTRYEIDPTKFSSQFINLLALAISIRIGTPITKDLDLVAELFRQYEIEKNIAWSTDAGIGNKHLHSDDDPNKDPFVDADFAYSSENRRF